MISHAELREDIDAAVAHVASTTYPMYLQMQRLEAMGWPMDRNEFRRRVEEMHGSWQSIKCDACPRQFEVRVRPGEVSRLAVCAPCAARRWDALVLERRLAWSAAEARLVVHA